MAAEQIVLKLAVGSSVDPTITLQMKPNASKILVLDGPGSDLWEFEWFGFDRLVLDRLFKGFDRPLGVVEAVCVFRRGIVGRSFDEVDTGISVVEEESGEVECGLYKYTRELNTILCT